MPTSTAAAAFDLFYHIQVRAAEIIRCYIRRGWCVFPLHDICTAVDLRTGAMAPMCGCRDPKCQMVGKHPAWKWTKVRKPPGRNEIVEAVTQRPFGGWAVNLGPSKLVAIDIDGKKGGVELRRIWEEMHGPFPHTLETRSGSGDGSGHLIFRAPDWIDEEAGAGSTVFHPFGPDGPHAEIGAAFESANPKFSAKSFEIFTGNHVLVLPPSQHKSGVLYTWLDENKIHLPEW